MLVHWVFSPSTPFSFHNSFKYYYFSLPWQRRSQNSCQQQTVCVTENNHTKPASLNLYGSSVLFVQNVKYVKLFSYIYIWMHIIQQLRKKIIPQKFQNKTLHKVRDQRLLTKKKEKKEKRQRERQTDRHSSCILLLLRNVILMNSINTAVFEAHHN